MKPIVAIVGRPNVGKSMLFNRLAGQRLSIVEDTPGVTRDRLYADCEWGGRTFTIVDTGGIEPDTDSEILQFMRDQAELAIQNANVIVLGVRHPAPVSPPPIRTWPICCCAPGKPVVLAVNKADSGGRTGPGCFMSSTIWDWAIPSPSPPSMATAQATCWRSA